MKIEYFADTDTLSIEFSRKAASDAIELSEGIVMDVDDQGHPVGLDIDQASKYLDLEHLDCVHLPFQIHQAA